MYSERRKERCVCIYKWTIIALLLIALFSVICMFTCKPKVPNTQDGLLEMNNAIFARMKANCDQNPEACDAYETILKQQLALLRH